MHMTYMFGGIVQTVTDFLTNIWYIIRYLPHYLTELFKWLVFGILYRIFTWICILVDFVENLFKSLAGIDAITVDGAQYGGSSSGQDLVYAFITNEEVMKVFWAIIALSLVLLLVFTIVAFIKSEFTLDLKSSAKGPIIGRAFKSVVNLIAVPAVSIIAIFGVNFLTRSIYNLFSGVTGGSLAAQCFSVGAYPANRVRSDDNFDDYLSNTSWATGNIPFSGNGEALAKEIDNQFKENKEGGLTFNKFEPPEKDENEENIGYGDWCTLIFGYPKANSPFNYANIEMVNYFYDLAQFQYLFAIGSAVTLAWTLLTVCLVLVKRVFELTILFLLAPPMTAIAPLDGGQAEKKWRQEFTKRLLSVVGTVFAYNMYFLLLPIFQSIEIFGETDNPALNALGFVLNLPIVGFFNNLFQIICVMVGVTIIKSASGLISTLLGIEDLVKSGGEAAKKALASGKAAVGLAAGVSLAGIKGTSMALKAMGAGPLAAVSSITTSKMRRDAKSQLGSAEEGVTSAQAEVDGYDKRIKDIKESDDYVNTENEIASLSSQGPLSGSDAKRLEDLKKAKETMDSSISSLTSKKVSAQERLDEAKRNYGFRKEGISEAAQAKIDKKYQAVKDRRASELEGLDPNSEEYKKKSESINSEARAAAEKSARFTRFRLGTRNAITNAKNAVYSEFGEHADKTSAIAQATSWVDKKVSKGLFTIPEKVPLVGGMRFGALEKVPFARKISEQVHSISEWAGASTDHTFRRIQDFATSAMGETGGAAFKFFVHKNERASWFESVPENRERDSKIQNSNTMKGRDLHEEEKAKKAAKKAAMEEIKRLLAYERGLTEYEDLLKKKEAPGTSQVQIDKINAQIKELELKGGVNSLEHQAEDFYKKAAPGSERAKRLEDFREKMQFDATKETIQSEMKQTARRNAASEALGVVAQKGSEVNFSDQTAQNLAKAIANALFNPNGKGFKIADGIKLDTKDLATVLGNSMTPLAKTMEDVADALKELISNNKNNKP